jgi:Fe-S-cluster-containing dehydrogenase component
MAKKKYSMVIDLQKCVGCGACAMACKTENNTQAGAKGQTFNWADFSIKAEGKFPDVKYVNRPVLCNHCDEPKCLEGCPEPRALYKTEDGITMYNQRYCIQCRKCFSSNGCPYSSEDVEKDGADYSVISFNEVGEETHAASHDQSEAIPGVTCSGAEIAKRAGATPPSKHAYEFKDRKRPEAGQKSRGKGKLADVRKDGWVEKCTFCIHRVRNGEDPYCVVSCPAKARIFGDRNDPSSEVSKLLKKHKPARLKNNKGELLADGEKGTAPNVFYIRDYKKA